MRCSDPLLSSARLLRVWPGQDLTFLRTDQCISRAASVLLAPIGIDIAIYTYRKLYICFFRKTSIDLAVKADSQQPFNRVSLNRGNSHSRRWTSCRLVRYVFVSRILFRSVLPVAGSSKKLAVFIKSQPIKMPVCILYLMHTAIVSKRNATPKLSDVEHARPLFASGYVLSASICNYSHI